jgi:hypothetical protein
MRRHRRGCDVDHGDNMSIPLRPQTAPESVKEGQLHEAVSNEVSTEKKSPKHPTPVVF